MMNKNNERRIISFDKDIIEHVYEKLEGRYTHSQIENVLRASVTLIRQRCVYSRSLGVSLPENFGFLIGNLHMMKRRLAYLNRLARRTPADEKEKGLLEEKIQILNERKLEKKYKIRGVTLFRDPLCFWRVFSQKNFSKIRYIMDCLFFNRKIDYNREDEKEK